ncbi:MAG: methyltransferase domain-containing protein [Sphingomonadaceae bacterium]
MSAPEIFDRKARQMRRDRRATDMPGFFAQTLVDDLVERLDCVQRRFTRALVIGAEPLLLAELAERGIPATVIEAAPRRAGRMGALVAEEDALVLPAEQFDLALSSGVLDTVSDLPGALILLRRALSPDGLFLGNMAGAPSLPALRAAVTQADAERGRAVARFHPQIDVRSAGDLLVRAGFALPVADLDTLDIAYIGLAPLLADLRAAGATNVLAQRHSVTRGWLARVADAFARAAGPDGRTHEALSFITLTGWAPADNQPKPAQRGSATASLAKALGTRR